MTLQLYISAMLIVAVWTPSLFAMLSRHRRDRLGEDWRYREDGDLSTTEADRRDLGWSTLFSVPILAVGISSLLPM